MARMTKADIIESVYEKVGGFSKKEAAEIVETVFDTIKETLERGEKIKISGFGNFVVRDKNARVGAGVRLTNERRLTDEVGPDGNWYIREGIIIVPKNGIVPDGTVV